MASIYVHIPFCSQRCHYCDFYFVTSLRDRDRFVDALVHEVETQSTRFVREPVESVYFGGGTPSRLGIGGLESILSGIRERFDVVPDAETTLEANPEDLDRDVLRGLKDLGINRLSIGIQSLSDGTLEFMNRAHDAQTATRAVEEAWCAGFHNLSVDLIYAVPGQTPTDLDDMLDWIATQRLPHVSMYNLTVEPGTVLNNLVQRGHVEPVPAEAAADQYTRIAARLRSEGLLQYEVSNFARQGFASIHNRGYWTHTNYLGFGPSAHSFWREDGQASRWWNVRSLRHYMDGQNPVETEILDPFTLVFERLMLALRTTDGISTDELAEEYGFSFSKEAHRRIEALAQEGLVTFENRQLKLTLEGLLVSDGVARDLCERRYLEPVN